MFEGSVPTMVRSVTSPALRLAAMGLVLVMLTVALPAGAADAPAVMWGNEVELVPEAYNLEYDVAASGSNVFIVYRHQTPSEADIYGRSFDGTNWSTPKRLEVQPYLMGQGYPAVAMDARGTHIVWQDSGDGDADVYYRFYDGSIWWSEVEVSHDTAGEMQGAPDVAADGGKVHVVYSGRLDTDNDIYYRSFDGTVWGPEAELSSDAGTEWQIWPAVAASAGRVHAVWEERSGSLRDVYYRCFDGMRWLPEVRMNAAPFESSISYPRVAATGDRVIVAWTTDVEGAYYRVQNGTAWGPVTQTPPLTAGQRTGWPAVSAEAGRLFLAYSVEVGSDWEVYMMQDGGAGWSTPEVVSGSAATGDDYAPSLAVSDGRAHVIWDRNRPGYDGIWYRDGVMDAAPPESMATSLPSWITGGTLDVLWHAEDDYGLSRVDLYVSERGTTGSWSRWTVLTSTQASGSRDEGMFRLEEIGDGYYHFATVATDLFGHIEEIFPGGDTEVACDSTPPNGSISIMGGAAFTNDTDTAIDVEWRETMLGLGTMIPEESPIQARFSNDGVWDTEQWGHLSTVAPVCWTLADGDGPKTVWCQLRNPAGLVSATLTDGIVLDTTAPSASMVIGEGSTYTTKVDVTLLLGFADALSGVDAVRYSNDDVWDTEPWEAPAVSRAWQLPAGDGTKTVYFQVRDRAGNIADVNDTIILDTTRPRILSYTPAHGERHVDLRTSVVIIFSEEMDRTVTAAAVQVTRGPYLVGGLYYWSENGTTLTFTPAGVLDMGVEYEVTVSTGRDLAGIDTATQRIDFTTWDGGGTSNDNSASTTVVLLVALLAIIALVIALVAYMRKAK